MRTADWHAVSTPEYLLIGENSTLQWKDESPEHAMFLDYFFEDAPYDLGERSRYSEARTIFKALFEMTAGECRPEQVHGTLLCNERLARPPKGKHLYIPLEQAQEGLTHIESLLKRYPTLTRIFVVGLQANYYLQKLGFYSCGEQQEAFLQGAEPRRTGLSAFDPYYQPVNAKPFREVCFGRYALSKNPAIEVIPILPVKSYPLTGSELTNYGERYLALQKSFQ